VTDSPAEAAVPSEHALGYALWAVLRRDPARRAGTGDLGPALAAVEATGVTVRGFYDVSSIRADADLMVWLHGPVPERLQAALRTLRRSEPLATLLPTWNVLGVHREAEFSATHQPAFLRGLPPQRWLTVYPFVRSYEWYLLPPEERRQMLADHGRKGASHRSVLSNTVASFGISDYEWILALEAPELVDLVDLMRHLRDTDARRHVREEIPFYAGRRIAPEEIAEVLE
jgi:chlorite dismutase